MPIYTRTGDQGETGLATGDRLSKDDAIFELLGTIDELNASIGIARALLHTWLDPIAAVKTNRANMRSIFLQIQNELFYIGALVAGSKTVNFNLQQKVVYWEQAIDGIETQLKPLKNFILPGGSRVAAALHLSRAICRRLERAAVQAQKTSAIPKHLIQYFNRLGDFLFVLARFANHIRKVDEIIWP